jgi:ABC-type multidrug transport system fused ATPase/permease subunit
VEDVSFTYPEATRPALRDVSLTIRAGEVIALVGPSGAGKSTFASLLLRLADPQLGVVRLDGHDVRELTLDSVRSAVGVLLQDAPILDASARDNIAYGAGDVDDAAVIAAVRQQTRMPSSPRCPTPTTPAWDGRGAACRSDSVDVFAIARTLLRDTPVVVLDELLQRPSGSRAATPADGRAHDDPDHP